VCRLGDVARRRAWVELDGIEPHSVGVHRDLVCSLRSLGLLGRVLLSHDAGWYEVGRPGGGKFRPFTTLFDELLPELEREGLTGAELHRLVVENPREAFAVRVRSVDA
jgi:phosphotriesterase-related protein